MNDLLVLQVKSPTPQEVTEQLNAEARLLELNATVRCSQSLEPRRK